PGQTDRAELLALVLDLTFSTDHLYHYTAVSLGHQRTAGSAKLIGNRKENSNQGIV
ncbi:MAG: hypothetical protein JWP37_85, partial [Mucilaginibacter sp.]|nr:hypothetical protein [Mucilaginibacter sp.]